MNPASINDPIGFLFEVKNSHNELKGYLYGADHRADKEMLTVLQNKKVQEAFQKSVEIAFENEENFVKDLARFGKGNQTFRAILKDLDQSAIDFTKITKFTGGPLDNDAGVNKPGVDFHLLAEAYRELKPVRSLENSDASHQEKAENDSAIAELFRKNLEIFLENNKEAASSLIQKPESYDDHPLTKDKVVVLLKAKNQAWRDGDQRTFLKIDSLLHVSFLKAVEKFDKNLSVTDSDEDKYLLKEIAFQRNREIKLAEKIDEILHEPNKVIFVVVGTSHLVTSTHFNLLALVKARGWVIHQITNDKK